MRTAMKAILTSICLLASASAAYATPISGAISIAGMDTFDSSQINFTSKTGVVLASTGTLAAFSFPDVAALQSFSFASPNVTVFSVSNAFGTASFNITDLLTDIYGSNSSGPTLSLSGIGTFQETGFENTTGTFSLTSSTAGITSFQLVSTAAETPEPSSLVLLGTGLFGVAGAFYRRVAS